MKDSDKQKIIELKEKIDNHTEYLNSEACSICGKIAIELENYISELSAIIKNL